MAILGVVEFLAPLTSMGLLEAVRRYLPQLAAQGSRRTVASFIRWMILARLGLIGAWALLLIAIWPAVAGWLGFDAAQRGTSLFAAGLVITVLGFRYLAEMLECLLEMRRHGVGVSPDWEGVLRAGGTAFVAIAGGGITAGIGPWHALAVTLLLLVAGLWIGKPLRRDELLLAERGLKGYSRMLVFLARAARRREVA